MFGALLFFVFIFPAQAADSNSAYGVVEQTSKSIKAGVNTVGENSGDILGIATGFFGLAGEFFNKITSWIGNVITNYPKTFNTVSAQAGGVLSRYFKVIVALVSLIIIFFILRQLLKIGALRKFLTAFLIKGIVSLIIIIGLAGLLAWTIGSLPALEKLDSSLGSIVEKIRKDFEAELEPQEYAEEDIMEEGIIIEDELIVAEGKKIFNEEEETLLSQIAQVPSAVFSAAKKAVNSLMELLPFVEDSIDGGWSDWNDWSECSVTCGGGTAIRARECNNPAPQGNGKYCPGISRYFRNCNIQACPAEDKACSEECFNDCGAYKDINECIGNICASCPLSCESEYDCDFGSAYCGYASEEDYKADKEKTCLYRSTPLLSDFNVIRMDPGTKFKITWDLDPWETREVDYFELWRKPVFGNWEIVSGYELIDADVREVIDEPEPGKSYSYGLHIIEKSEYTAYPSNWLAEKGYTSKDINKITDAGYSFDDLDRIRKKGLSAEDEEWFGDNGYSDIENIIRTEYSTEKMSGFFTVPMPAGLAINTTDFFSYQEGHYSVFVTGGAINLKKDKIFGQEAGPLTQNGGYSPQASIFVGHGVAQYFYKGDSEEDYDKIMVLSPYTNTDQQPLWLMGEASGIYGETAGGMAQSPWSKEQLRNYFKDIGISGHVTQVMYYQHRENNNLTPYADPYFPVGMQELSAGNGRWKHGDRPFTEWQSDTYYLGGNYQSLNSGFVEAVRWTADDYLNYVNSYYHYIENTSKDFVGLQNRSCDRETDYFNTKGVYNNNPFCPSQRLLAALDETAGEYEYNIMRIIFYEDVPSINGRCAHNGFKIMHPYQNGVTITMDEQTQAGGYPVPDTTCIYEGYYLRGYDMLARNWPSSNSAEIGVLNFSVDTGDNALLEFMIGQPVKGSRSTVYMIEADGLHLYKYMLTAEEFNNLGGRYIPISDEVLNNIPSLN